MKPKKNVTPENLVKVRNVVWYKPFDGNGMFANTAIGIYSYEFIPGMGKWIARCLGIDGEQLWYKEYNLEESARHASQDHYKRTVFDLLEVK